MIPRPRHRTPCRTRNGYTLVEVLVVLVILGLLVTLVAVGLRWAVRDAETVAFQEQLRRYATAAEVFRLRTGGLPPSAAPGELPAGLEEYIRESDWASATPIGGRWSYHSSIPGGGGSAGVGVSFEGDATGASEDVLQLRIAAQVQRVDEEIDDGDLDTGGFRQVGDASFYMILN